MADPKLARSLQALARSLTRLERERARALGITPQQAEALQIIGEHRDVSTSSLALELGIDPSTASRNLAGLARSGYIVRFRGHEDGRHVGIRLTPKGKRKAEAIAVDWLRACSLVLGRLPPEERQRTAQHVDVLVGALGSNAGR
ncbi:MAG: MarR family winged helix-turn-helix transcriptional regulator [Polyangiaceae bacterium]|jgi:DNA-binding MarR family transcriptional regulator